MKRETPIPESKKKLVNELEELIKNKKTILVTSIKNIPGSQFQEIVKKIRDKAIVKVPKKSLIFRAIDGSKESVKEIKEKIDESFAILFSDIDAFELAGELMKNQSPAKAKPGQEAPEEIEIPEGPTDLVPGPAVSELGALGIQIKIDKGKINITSPKVVAEKGEKIKPEVAALMSKLDIKPFKIGFVPVAAFDTSENKFYSEINIDVEGTAETLRYSYGKALPFALEIGYVTEETAKLMVSKAAGQERRLIRVINGEPEEVVAPVEDAKEVPKEEPKEEKKEAAAEGLGALFG